MENAISNLAFGGWKIWGGKCYLEISNLGWWKIWGGNCYLESRILGVENLGWKMLSRISNFENLGGKFGVENAISNLEFGGRGKFGVENAISKFLIWGGGKFGVENVISNLEFGGWKICGGKCYLEISKLGKIWGWKIWGGKCYLEPRIWGVENLGWKMLSRISNLGGGKFGVENAISNLAFGG